MFIYFFCFCLFIFDRSTRSSTILRKRFGCKYRFFLFFWIIFTYKLFYCQYIETETFHSNIRVYQMVYLTIFLFFECRRPTWKSPKWQKKTIKKRYSSFPTLTKLFLFLVSLGAFNWRTVEHKHCTSRHFKANGKQED